MHRLAWGPYACGGPRATARRVHALRRHWIKVASTPAALYIIWYGYCFSC
jgi:hypothetical protein